MQCMMPELNRLPPTRRRVASGHTSSYQCGIGLRSRGLEERACLLLGNCLAHPPADSLKSTDKKVYVYYLPKKTTSKIQLLYQGIISSFKANYRCHLIKAIVEEDSSVPGFLKALNVKDAVYLCEDACRAVKPDSIHNC